MKTISKRFLKGGLALLLAFVMLFGTTITGLAAVVDNAETSANVDVADTKATVTFTSDDVLFFNMKAVSWWTAGTNGNGNFAYFFNNSTNKNAWSAHAVNYSGDIYYVKIPAGTWEGVILTRNNTSTSPTWNNKWNQTGDIALSSTSNYISKFSENSTSATWGTQKPTSSGSLAASKTTANVNEAVTLTPSLTSNTTYNEIKSTSYSISPSTGASISGNTFTATAAGTYTVTATITYNPRGYSSLTSTVTATKTITVTKPSYTYTATAGTGGSVSATPASPASSVTVTATPDTGYKFDGWTATNGTVTDASAISTTFTPSANGANVHASFSKLQYALTINESVAGGTFTVDGATFTSGSKVTHGEHTLGVTAPDGYKVTSINGGTANPATINVTGATTVEVVYELEGSCAPHFDDTSKMNLVLGEEKTRTASLNQFSTADCGITYSSSNTGVATVNATTGKVKALTAGTTTITATCSNHSSTATYQVEVLAPTFTVAAVSVDVNGEVSAVPTITANEPAGAYSFKYTTHASNNSNYYAVTEDGRFTGLKPGSAIANAALVYGGETVASAPSFNVTVNAVDVNLNKSTAKILTGQTVQLEVSSDITPDSISWSKDTVVTVDTNGLVSTTADTGTGNVTATVKYNDYYTETLTCAVTVAEPTLTVSPTTLNLEIGDGSTATTGTVTVTNNDTAGADGTDAVVPVLTVTSSKPEVATATVVDGEISVTAQALGTTTLTVSYRGVEKEVPVNVSQYDPYVYLYVTDNNGWGSMYVYSWKGSNTVVTPITTSMIYIGKNDQGQNIFAYRFLKTNKPENVIFAKNSSWGSQTADTAINWNTTNHRAFYFASSSDRSTMTDWTSSCMIVRPTVSVEDLTVIMGETGTAEATVENGDKVLWTIDDTTYATVADVATKTATVTSVAPGTTEISARAFVDTANSSIKTLPTNYKTDTACWPYISTEATATVTVDPGSARQITVAPSFSNDGETYTPGVTTGGTVNATYESQSGTSLEVPYNGEYTITATPADGYAFNGWTKNNEDIEGGATLTVAAKDNANYVAKFVKTYTVTVATPAGIDSIKINNAPGTTYTAKAGETITVYGSPAEGYRLGNWTVEGTATATGTNTATATISNIQSNITVTPSAVKIYTVTYSQGVNRVNATVGTVTVNGSTDNNQEFDAGTEVTLVASSTNRSFYGWYAADDTNFENPLSTNATYEIASLDSDVSVVAMFYRPFTIEGDVPGSQVVLTYDIATDTYTGTSNDYQGNAFTVSDTFGNTANAADVNVTGGTHTGASVTGNANGYTLVPDTENYDTSAPITYTMRNMGIGTYYLDIALSDAEKVEISVNGVKVAEKAIGSKFSYEIEAPDGQYLSNATIDPAIDYEIVDGKIEFTVPDTNVNIVPAFANYSYVVISNDVGITHDAKSAYKAGEEVTITLSPSSEATTITNVVSDNDSAVVAQNGDSWTVTISSMPADTTITLTPTVDAKFVMSYDMKAIGNYGTSFTSYGTVSMKIGETTLAKDGYAGPTDTVTYTATPTTNYIFDGWYSDSECSLTKLLSRNTSYDVKPTADTTIYALFVPKHYLAYDQAQTGTNVEMTYVPADRAFIHETSTIPKDAWFRVTNDKSGWNDSNSYSQFGSEFAVNFNGNGYDLNIDWGTQCYRITDGSDKDYPFTIVVTLDGNESIDVSARTVKTGNTVLLSSGRNNIGYATTTVLTEGITGESKSISHDGDTENYLKIKNLPIEGQTLTWETTIGGTNASGLYIESYIAYSMDTGLWEVIEPVSLGNNKYQGTALINSDTYIAPVFFHTEEYNEANGLVPIELYFDASAIKNLKWGPFVSCYSWSADESVKYFGSWPGQLMIPTPDGKSYYTQLDVPAAGSANPAAGVTFSNYMFATCPVQEGGLFGVTTQNIQTYDYREAITLYESNYDVITFVAKTSYDGYHGDEPNGVDHNPVSSSTTAAQLFANYEFDYLYRRDGVTPMNFNGDEVVGPKAVDAADYYIVSKGDRDIDAGGYAYDTNYNGNWSVEWYIFDKDGNYQTKVLSTALWHDTNMADDVRQTVLLDALNLTPEQAADKTVAISYELANHADGDAHKLAYDGQWYGNYLDDTVNAQVKVGLEETDGVYVIDDDETPNIADYGEAYIDDLNGNNVQSLDIKIDYGIVHTTSHANGNYRFVGWFTKDAAGEFIPYKNTPAFKEYINMDETYYAIFKPIGDEEIVINHIRYENTDPIIPSHGGVGELSIRVTDVDTNEVIATGPVNTALSTAIFTATDLKTYKIEIITTPLMNGEFFAWYTDSYNVDGTKTYEEVMTYDEAIGSTSQVIGEFEYTYDSEDQSQLKVINIYSDIRKVSNEAVLKYRYINRYGQPKTYTVSGIVLTDDECTGFEGNDGMEYVPAFRTYCKFRTPEGEEWNVYLKDEDIQDYIDNDYTLLESENKIQYYAPKADVTEVYNGTVEWIIADTYLTPQKSEVVLIAKQDEPLYEVKYYMAGNSYSKQGYYNDLLAIQAPLQYEGEDFSYWYDNTNKEILTYTNHYNYRIIENRDIKAVYGVTDLAEWTPTIEYVTPTREFSDNSDYIYTDYHLAYTSRDGKILNDVKGTENIQYGLLLARDADYYFDGEGTPTYLQFADIENDLKQVITNGKSTAINGNNIYFYDLTALDLTNFNRCDYFLKYDNNKVIGGSHYYREYAFTAVAYMVVDGEIYLSNPDFVNFHELGSMDYDNINNN